MDWTAVGVIASTVLGLVALLVSWRDRMHAKNAGVAADSRADRTEAIADRAAVAGERMALVMESQALAVARSAPTPEAAWTLEHFQGDLYMLTNAGDGTAYDVHVDTGDLGLFNDNEWGAFDREAMPPGGSALPIKVWRSMATSNATITVTWAATPGGETRAWSRPLPPQPSVAPAAPGRANSLSSDQARVLVAINDHAKRHGRLDLGDLSGRLPGPLADLGIPAAAAAYASVADLYDLGLIEGVKAWGPRHPIVVTGLTARGRQELP